MDKNIKHLVQEVIKGENVKAKAILADYLIKHVGVKTTTAYRIIGELVNKKLEEMR